jgi:phage repressor protein C with HTH and peptisase S24 domain
VRLPLSIFRISGHSMEPSIKNGSLVLVWQWIGKIEVGDAVLFKHNKEYWVKRVKSIKDEEVELVGDNLSDSFDSRKLGAINIGRIVGKVIRA